MRKSDMKYLLISFLYCCLWLAILCPYASAHDAFYPHHKQDFQELQQNRGRIAIVTAIFLTLLTVGIVFGLRKGELGVNEDAKAVQGRLRQYAVESAKTAMKFLKDEPASALRVCLYSYAQIAGVSWKEESITGYVSSLSCKIGEDSLKAKIFRKGDLVNLELLATCNEAGAKVVVSESGEIHSSVFIN